MTRLIKGRVGKRSKAESIRSGKAKLRPGARYFASSLCQRAVKRIKPPMAAKADTWVHSRSVKRWTAMTAEPRKKRAVLKKGKDPSWNADRMAQKDKNRETTKNKAYH